MIRDLLSGGDLRSIGSANEVARMVAADPELFEELIGCLWDRDPVVAARAADAAEKTTRDNPQFLQPWRSGLIGLLEEATVKELRWHLALMAPRMKLAPAEKRRVCEALALYLEDTSSIVKTFALQGLFDLAKEDPELRPDVLDRLRILTRAGTPAMRARGRKLLKAAEAGWTR